LSDLQTAYEEAQFAMAKLKSLVRSVLEQSPDKGLKNSEIGRVLGIYAGHVEHISRTLLAMLEAEGVVVQNEHDKTWALRRHL
jgi:DNA-directed RNA polymerase specialized sigma24 family protein